jgi:hypothetical protein
MKELKGDLFTEGERAITVITTNGVVTKKGKCVMRRGVAKTARDRFPCIDSWLGECIQQFGNHVFVLTIYLEMDGSEYKVLRPPRIICSLPVKTHWRDKADMQLIERSLGELVMMAHTRRWERVVLPRPGCGNGQILWKDVKPMMEEILDDRFVVVHP